ncbi:hypothetical protein QAD02_019094 [Eretmocerus hayati]|uniref:Uncharacterized protein n=1 Tax=Eretmocerus hayati TaxID=131215 RepID=A0ACC2PIV4_9HYME|nr:hypothetical protein QAD02_019094 [Eretmocerus hayati]
MEIELRFYSELVVTVISNYIIELKVLDPGKGQRQFFTIESSHIVIWRTSYLEFVAVLKSGRLIVEKVAPREFYDLQGEAIKLAYFEEKNLVTFHNNGTEISGFIGELWNLLSGYLNFTLVPMRIPLREFGQREKNGSFNGLVGLLERNETQIVPRAFVYKEFSSTFDYTISFLRTQYSLYVKPSWKRDVLWVFKSFTVELWIAVPSFLLILCIGGYAYEKYGSDASGKMQHDLEEHATYTIAIATQQADIPDHFYQKSKQICIVTSFFTWIIISAFNSLTTHSMVNKDLSLPFNDLKQLIQQTDYNIVAIKGSVVDKAFKEQILKYSKHADNLERVTFVTNAELYDKVCHPGSQKWALFIADDRHKLMGRDACDLVRAPTVYYDTWIAAGVTRGFHKQIFNHG